MDWLIIGVLIVAGIVFYLADWAYFIAIFSKKIPRTGAGLILCIVGLSIPLIGCFVGAWYVFAGPSPKRLQALLTNKLKNANPETIVDMIDEFAARPGIQSQWLEKNWNGLSDKEKVKWIAVRQEILLRYLPEALDDESTILALQRADREFTRGTPSAA